MAKVLLLYPPFHDNSGGLTQAKGYLPSKRENQNISQIDRGVSAIHFAVGCVTPAVSVLAVLSMFAFFSSSSSSAQWWGWYSDTPLLPAARKLGGLKSTPEPNPSPLLSRSQVSPA